jgi:hypothetical protein
MDSTSAIKVWMTYMYVKTYMCTCTYTRLMTVHYAISQWQYDILFDKNSKYKVLKILYACKKKIIDLSDLDQRISTGRIPDHWYMYILEFLFKAKIN